MFHERTKWIVYAGAVASALLQDSHAACGDKSIESKVYGLKLYRRAVNAAMQHEYSFPRID